MNFLILITDVRAAEFESAGADRLQVWPHRPAATADNGLRPWARANAIQSIMGRRHRSAPPQFQVSKFVSHLQCYDPATIQGSGIGSAGSADCRRERDIIGIGQVRADHANLEVVRIAQP